MNDPRLTHLLDLYLDGTLSSEEASELEQLLGASTSARRQFWEYTALHGATHEAAKWKWAGQETSTAQVAPNVVRVSFGRWLRPAALAAAACVALLVSWFFFGRDAGSPAAGVAVLTRAVGVEWTDGVRPVPGAILSPGWLKLKAGAVQVEFYAGARVVVEGPAEFRVASAREGFLRTGKVRAQVPEQARGFRIVTSLLSAVDLGTEFGVNVPPTGLPEVHVFAGRVEVTRPGTGVTNELVAGKAVRLQDHQFEAIAVSRAGFLSEDELARRDVAGARRRHEAWQQSARNLSADPAAVIHFTFEDQSSWDRALTNRAAQAAAGTQGDIVGCPWTEGRWPGKRALEFKGEGDRVRLQVPGALTNITLLAWVRVDGWPHQMHELFSGESEAPGTLRWELSRNGELRLGIVKKSAGPAANWEVVTTPEVVTSERFGQWMMLVTVFDGKGVSHYVDGQLVIARGASGPRPLTVGRVELGNWSATPEQPEFEFARSSGRGYFARGFQGRIDEFALLARALKAEEVQRLYEAGKPALAAARVAEAWH